MSKLLDQVQTVLRTRHYSYRTEKTYMNGVLGTKAHFFTLSNLLLHKIRQFSHIFDDFCSNFFIFGVLLHTIHAYNG